MYLSKIRITLRPSILDPQGKAVGHAIASLGVNAVRDVRMGKYVELKVEGPSERKLVQLRKKCARSCWPIR